MTPWTVEEALRWADTFGPSEEEAPTGNEMALAALAYEVRKQAITIERLRLGHERYETVRRMNVPQFADASGLSISTGKPFDEIIDDLRPFMRPDAAPTTTMGAPLDTNTPNNELPGMWDLSDFTGGAGE